jgi:DNA-binding NarL/FixJ family response regulator
LTLVSGGLSNRDIARELFIAEATVKVHLSHAYEKLGVSSRTAAALRVPHHARFRRHLAHEPEAQAHPKS